MKLTLEVWRQKNGGDKGGFSTYELEDVDTHMSFLEMLDVLNQDLIVGGEEPIAFEHDCREGICGACGFVVNGVAHGHQKGSTICQLHMRHFSDGDKITIEPWRAKAFPIIKDLVVDRSSFDRILQAGGFVTIRTGSAPDANALPGGDRHPRACDGLCRVHRLRRLRGLLSERCGDALCGRQDLPPRSSASGDAGEGEEGLEDGRGDGERGLRGLHQLHVVRGGVPEGDLDLGHRSHEQGLPAGVRSGSRAGARQKKIAVGKALRWQR